LLTLALARPQPQPSPSLKPSPSPSPSPRRDQEKRSELLERWVEGPSLSAEGKLVMPEVRSRNGENSRAVGLAWKALSREEKQRWEAESQKDLKRYQAECAQAGVEPKLYSHVAGQLRNARRAVRPVDNVGGAGLVDPKAAYKVTGNIPRIGFAGATRPFPQKRPASGAMGGALARLEQPSGQPTVTPTRRRIEQPSESTTAPAAGKRWNAATRSFV